MPIRTSAHTRFLLTDQQYNYLLNAGRPLLLLVDGSENNATQQERANAAWEKIAAELHFNPATVCPPAANEDQNSFYAIPTPATIDKEKEND